MQRRSSRVLRLVRPRRARRWVAAASTPVLSVASGCRGPASTLDPAGRGAELIAELFWWLLAGAAIVWLVVVALAVLFARARPSPQGRRAARALIIGGGAVFPTVVLGGMLVYGLALMPDLSARAPPGTLRIAVSGEQWWWRVRYLPAGEDAVTLANEIHLPVGEPVELLLESPDVIHAFWIPSLGGKLDMVPGRVNRLVLRPTRTGVFHGVCAEYCGTSHALMRFVVVVEEKDAFLAWLRRQAEPAPAVAEPLAARGAERFLANGCGACHTVRGTPADGVVGPDLTHVGSRSSLGAGILPNDPAAFRRWIGHTEAVKPGVLMPSFGMLPPEELEALSAYLEALR